ncbi:MAG: VOC family protein [Acidobacteriota bacterium]|nr:VOC family protein [Acidobacteriota bacterium]
MAGKVKAVPDGTHSITAHLMVRQATKAIEFYQKAFGAQVLGVHKTPDGKVMHATLKVGDSQFMLADEFPGMSNPAAQTLGGSPVVINLYSENVDTLFNQAVTAGATVKMPLANQFWGDRYGQIVDPFGHSWALGAHIEDVAPEEMERRANAIFAEMGKKAGA